MADIAFDDEALRALIDLRDAYEATLELWRDLGAHEGRMVWKSVGGKDYLYHVFGRGGNGHSLGPRGPETEARYASFRSRKDTIRATLAQTTPDLKRAAAVYVALGLPVLDGWTARLLQHLDRERVLGDSVLVVGTNAMPAYQIEAQVRSGQRMHATRDVDLAWAVDETPDAAILWPALREFAPDATLNLERPFQVRTSGRHEIELLAAPSQRVQLLHEPFDPVPLPEQEWLLLGTPLRHVVSGMERSATALVVPDPRYFALHKAWLADKPSRDPLKRPKDRRQAAAVWRWLRDGRMPRYALDAAFEQQLPEDLRATFDRIVDG